MPVIRAAQSVVHQMHGTSFTSYASPARGSRELCAWRIEIPGGTEGVPHHVSREEVLYVLDGILRVYKIDQTALFFDARTAADFARVSLPGTHNVPADQLAAGALSKAPMPRDDFNTRIILFGRDRGEARTLADAIGKTAMQNVSYFPGAFDALAAAVKTQ